MRFFRTASADLYESVRLQLDAAWGLADHGCTCITPAADSPRDESGRIVLAVDEQFCGYEAVQVLLPQLLSGGLVEEIDHATYLQAIAERP